MLLKYSLFTIARHILQKLSFLDLLDSSILGLSLCVYIFGVQGNFFLGLFVHTTKLINKQTKIKEETCGNKILPQNVILLNSVHHTGGFVSYLVVACNHNHHVVNHSEGFRSIDCTHTNYIEGFWSYLKSTVGKENGVQRNFIDDCIAQYTFKRIFLMNKKSEKFAQRFVKV